MAIADQFLRENARDEINISAVQRNTLLAHIVVAPCAGCMDRSPAATHPPPNARMTPLAALQGIGAAPGKNKFQNSLSRRRRSWVLLDV